MKSGIRWMLFARSRLSFLKSRKQCLASIFSLMLLSQLVTNPGCNHSAPNSTQTPTSASASTPSEQMAASATDGTSDNVKAPTEQPAQLTGTDKQDTSQINTTDPTVEGEASKDTRPSMQEKSLKRLPIPEGNWTKQRLIALTSKGPQIIDLMLRVGGLDLDAANAAAVQPIQESLLSQLGDNASWDSLLALPLIQSGWLGNLVAQGDQSAQLISIYDKNKDSVVQVAELTEFLTRGLSRSQPISIADSGIEPGTDSNKSPFGALDSDEDNVLSAAELEQGSNVLARLDFNGDSSISLNELSPMTATTTMANNAMGRSMLQSNSLAFHQPAANADEKSDRKQLQRKVIDVMEHYSFLGTIERQQWSGWSDAQWQQLDTNSDGQVDKLELTAIFNSSSAIRIAIDLPAPERAEGQPAWYFDDSTLNSTWSSDQNSAQLRSSLCDILMSLDDMYSARLKTLLRNRLGESFKNAQVKQVFIQQLQLQGDALELVDADNDQSISDTEFENVWRWLVVRQAARVQGRWMVAARPWFQLLDKDRNQSISEVELSRMPEVLGKADTNQDDDVDSSELPLVVRFQLSRQDPRVDLRGLQIADAAYSGGNVDADWFSAMDTNRDGSIAKQEFLGTNSEYQALDRDGDGFISQSEVY